MTLFFSEEERKYIRIDPDKEYSFYCSKNAPSRMKASIEKKLAKHREWLKLAKRK